MLFHEIYGKYYHTVAEILRQAVKNGSISQIEIKRIVSEHAFGESSMYIPEAVTEPWCLLTDSGEPVLRNSPEQPLTLTEKRWLKALLLDPRIQLFAPSREGLEDISPLFTPDMFLWFDRYEDGDPFEDPGYSRNFRLLLLAIIQKRTVRVKVAASNGEQSWVCTPCHLEYSEKDDKFRLLALQEEKRVILNLSNISGCELLEMAPCPPKIPAAQKVKLVLELRNDRNALERAMLHFSHLEKETSRLDNGNYCIILWYEPRDEREILIRILSFGPTLKVVSPDSLAAQIRYRIEKQRNLRTL